MRVNTSASQAFGSMSLSLAVMMSVFMTAALSAPRSEPANNHAFLSRAGRAGRVQLIVRETDPAVLGEAGKTVPALEHVVDGLNDVGGARAWSAARSAMSSVRPGAVRSALAGQACARGR